MSTTALRCLPLLVMLLLGACQSAPPHGTDAAQPVAPSAPPAPTAKQALARQFEQQLAAGELDNATLTFNRLRRQGDTETAEGYRQLLADAWLQRSQQALEKGDLNAATAALANARALMPKAPALTNGLGGGLQPSAPAGGPQ